MNPGVSIVISTRNRCGDAVTAIESSLAQRYEPLEVLLYDDASTDGTAEVVRDRFPEVRLVASDKQQGYLVWRNQGFRDASGEYVISLDDDSYFTDADTVTRVVELFAASPQAAAIALPYCEPQRGQGNSRMSPCPAGTPLRSYVGCAHAIRRQLALDAGGYRELLTHQGEEKDLCIRLRDHGWDIVYGDSPPLVHMYSENRDRQRHNYYGYRNTLLFSALNVPHPYAVPRMLLDSLQLLGHRFSLGALPASLHAVAAGWIAGARHLADRAPVTHATYRQYRSLPGHGPLEYPEECAPPLRRGSMANFQ